MNVSVVEMDMSKSLPEYRPTFHTIVNPTIEQNVDFMSRKYCDFLFLFEDRPVKDAPSYKWLRAIPSPFVLMPIYIGNIEDKCRDSFIDQYVKMQIGENAIKACL